LAEVLLLDSGAVTQLAGRPRREAALIEALRLRGQWPPLVLSPVLVECLRGDAGRDAPVNRLLKTCDLVEDIPQALARRAAYLRSRARTGSAVDALVVAAAEPRGTVLTSNAGDLRALAAYADGVVVEQF
jgi:hypothetical protein